MIKKFFLFIAKLLTKMKEDNIFQLSAQFSYYLILAIFPFLILSISILCNYSYFIYEILHSMESIIPSDIYDIVYSIVTKSLNSCAKPYIPSSLLILLWSATAGSATIIAGINRAYGFNVTRGYFFMRLEGIIFSFAIMVTLQIIFALIVLGNEIVTLMQNTSLLSDVLYSIIHIFRYVLPFLLMFLIFSAAYKYLTYEKVKFSFVFPGAAFATIGIITGSTVYSYYIGTRTTYYNTIYGNLSGVIIFLLWIFIMSIIFLTGAEINYFVGKNKQHKTGRGDDSHL